MKIKTWLPIAVALVLGTFAAMLAKNSLSSKPGTAATALKIVVAKRPIAPGEALTAADLHLRELAGTAAPEGAQTEPSGLIGRAAVAQILEGQPIIESMLAAGGTAGGLQALVPAGMRAMTIEVNEFSAVGGMVTPGARVDVLSTMLDARNSESMSRTIAQNVLVKAVGQTTGQPQRTEAEAKPVRSVTLLVTSKQAESIQLSTVAGRPWLVLRGQSDNAIAPSAGTTLADLRGMTVSGIAGNLFPAFKPAQVAVAPETTTSNPTTRPVAASTPTRSVHTIRATVENTITVAPLNSSTAGETYTSTTVEP